MSGKQLAKDFTKGNIPKQLLAFMLPFMASNALQVLYATVDMVIVGKFVGTAGLAAVSQSSLIVSMPTMFYLGFANAGQILLSQALGAKRKDEVNRIIGNMFSVILFIGLLLSGVLLCVREWAIGLMNVPAESYDMAMQYVVICGAGLIFTAGYNLISAIMRGMGDSQRPLLFIGIATAVNIVLDLLFTGLLGWGVAGAAWATIIGQAVSFLFSLYYLYKRKEAFGFDFKWESYIPKKHIVKTMISLGTPMAIQSGCINLSMLVVNTMINGMGVVASATFGVGCKIDDIINKISMGIQFAAMPMISQNFGAGEKERCKKVVYYGWIYAAIFTAICMTLYLTMGKELFMLFSDDPLVHEMSETFIRAVLWMFPAFVIMRGSSALVSGVGNAKLGLVLSLLDGVVLRIGLSWLFGIGFDMGFYGFVLGYGLAAYGFSVPGLFYFLSGKWEKRKTLVE